MLDLYHIMLFYFFLLFSLLPQCLVSALSPRSITIYYAPGQTPLANGTVPTASATPTAYDNTLQAYSPVTLIPPPPPSGTAIAAAFPLSVPSAVPQGASIQQSGAFMGFSIEMSVVNQVLGKNSSLLQVPFLNLMANLQQRVGRVIIRIGGNTQDTAALVPKTDDGRILEKDLKGITNPTQTPPLIFTPDFIQMMRNISDFVNVHWYLGVPFNDTNWRLGIVETGQAILGDFLIGIQAGNEPDLYEPHGHRPIGYDQADYFTELGSLVNALETDSKVNSSKLLIVPSVSSTWTPESVLFAGTGLLPTYGSNMQAISVQHYPSDNCAVAFPNSGGTVNNPQDLLPQYLSHDSATGNLARYLNTSDIALSNGFPLYMFETNTASCGGFPGLSDSFAAALWGIDYAMQMAALNFSAALFHVGGQSVSYNPFTPPPTNESTFHQWTIGPIYYSALVTAEALGPTNAAQVLDLSANNNNPLTPAYGIWEHGTLARVLLINFINDPSGGNTLAVDFTIPDGTAPAQVDVKLLLAANVTQKGNFTWGGQTYGGNFESDGRPFGTESVQHISCGIPSDNSSTTPVCRISVPAPGAALVFFSSSATAAEVAGAPSTTFSTSTLTKASLPSIAATDLAASNGHGGSSNRLPLGATSKDSFQPDAAVQITVSVAAWMAMIVFIGLAYLS